jgi:hypothetical protein
MCISVLYLSQFWVNWYDLIVFVTRCLGGEARKRTSRNAWMRRSASSALMAAVTLMGRYVSGKMSELSSASDGNATSGVVEFPRPAYTLKVANPTSSGMPTMLKVFSARRTFCLRSASNSCCRTCVT